MLEHGAKAAQAYNILMRETKPVEGKPPKLRAFAVGTVKSKGVVLVTKMKPIGAMLELTKMSKKMGNVTALANGYITWDEGELKLKCVKPASEASVRKAFLEYYSEYKVSPPSKKIVLLQPNEWSLEEHEKAAAEEEEGESEEEGVSGPTSNDEQIANNAYNQALAKLEQAVEAGVTELGEIAAHQMKALGHSVEQDGALDLSRIRKMLSRHPENFKQRAPAEGAGCAAQIHGELQNDINRLKLAASSPRHLEAMLGLDKGGDGKIGSKSWHDTYVEAVTNLNKLGDAIMADFANAEENVRSAVQSGLPRLEDVLSPIANSDLDDAIGSIQQKPPNEKAAAIAKVRQIKQKYAEVLKAKEIALIDANPFQVPVNLKGILGGALSEIEKGLADLEKSLPH